MLYLKYLYYILKHKYYVFVECMKLGLWWRGITHDLSKFRWSECKPYAQRFFGSNDKPKKDFSKGWCKHKNRNDHHPEYWILDGEPLEMSKIARKEMLADWKAMGKQRNNNVLEYYENAGRYKPFGEKTRIWLENMIGYNKYDKQMQIPFTNYQNIRR